MENRRDGADRRPSMGGAATIRLDCPCSARRSHSAGELRQVKGVSVQQRAFHCSKVRFGASKCVSERRNAFRSVKVRFGASKCVSERQSAFRSVKMRFGASKCISERQNAFRSKGVGGGPLRFECRIEI